VLTDRNGCVPTHNTRYAQTLTGKVSVDRVNNRTEPVFDAHVEIAVSRSTAPSTFQRCLRDNGEVLMDLGVPVTVRGKHLGAIRIGFRPGAQQAAPRASGRKGAPAPRRPLVASMLAAAGYLEVGIFPSTPFTRKFISAFIFSSATCPLARTSLPLWSLIGPR